MSCFCFCRGIITCSVLQQVIVPHLGDVSPARVQHIYHLQETQHLSPARPIERGEGLDQGELGSQTAFAVVACWS